MTFKLQFAKLRWLWLVSIIQKFSKTLRADWSLVCLLNHELKTFYKYMIDQNSGFVESKKNTINHREATRGIKAVTELLTIYCDIALIL